MGIIARNLDILQSEKCAYMGILVSSLSISLRKLDDIATAETESLAGCLAGVMKLAIEKRFTTAILNTKNRLAAALHPTLKLSWCEGAAARSELTDNVIDCVTEKIASDRSRYVPTEEMGDSTPLADANVDLDPLSAIFNDLSSASQSRPSNATDSVLIQQARDFLTLPRVITNWESAFPNAVMRDLFIEYNTPIPSSAGVERLFSTGKDTLRPKRASLKDKTFEAVMFLKHNRHLLPAEPKSD